MGGLTSQRRIIQRLVIKIETKIKSDTLKIYINRVLFQRKLKSKCQTQIVN